MIPEKELLGAAVEMLVRVHRASESPGRSKSARAYPMMLLTQDGLETTVSDRTLAEVCRYLAAPQRAVPALYLGPALDVPETVVIVIMDQVLEGELSFCVWAFEPASGACARAPHLDATLSVASPPRATPNG